MDRPTITDDPELFFDNRGYSFYHEPAIEQEHRQKHEFICEPSYLGFARARGMDAVEFLNGQFTNDLSKLSEGQSQLSGYCTPKGRLLSVFRIHHDRDDLLLQMHRDVITATVDRLRKYIMRAKVEVSTDESIATLGTVGEKCAAALRNMFGSLPGKKHECSNVGDLTIISYTETPPQRYQIIGTPSRLKPLWQQLSACAPKLGSWAWASMDIEQGLATVFKRTSEQFVPQMLNLDITQAVSFNKGCYPGQEIVARMHYLGKLKTRMILGSADAHTQPLPGDKVFAVGSEQSIGMVVDAMPGSTGYDLLATSRLENVQRDDLRLRNGQDVPIRLGQLPYPLHSEEQNQA